MQPFFSSMVSADDLITSWGWSHTPISPVQPSISWLLLHPPVHLQKWFSPHLPSVCLSCSLSLGFAPPTHTLCKCQSSETERERVGGFVYLGSWVQLVLLAYSNKVCVREKARRVLHWEKSAFEEEKNRERVERRIFCSYYTFFSLQRIAGSIFARRKERVN